MYENICKTAPADAPNDIVLQLSKVAAALLSDKYVPPPPADVTDDVTLLEKYVIAPRMFKHAVSKGHREFSSGKQQDASEYFQFLLQTLEHAERTAAGRFIHSLSSSVPSTRATSSLFAFEVEQRLQCQSTGQVRSRFVP